MQTITNTTSVTTTTAPLVGAHEVTVHVEDSVVDQHAHARAEVGIRDERRVQTHHAALLTFLQQIPLGYKITYTSLRSSKRPPRQAPHCDNDCDNLPGLDCDTIPCVLPGLYYDTNACVPAMI